MKEKLIKLGFEKWLSEQELAPYTVMFWDTPKFIQLAYIQKFLREYYTTHLEVNVNILREWYCTGYDLAEKRCAEIPELYYESEKMKYGNFEEALEAGINKVLEL